MITVAILINGQPILARSAVNQVVKNENGETKYLSDCGKEIFHNREDGAVPLCKKLLDLINSNF